MVIDIDNRSGFCFGVVRAIEIAEETLSHSGKVLSLGDIVHNDPEVERLTNLGLSTISLDRLDEQVGKTVVIRAHGEPPTTYEKAKELGVNLIDATCPVVAQLQQKVRKAHKEMHEVNGTVVILGKKGHAEVVGLTGQIEEQAVVVEKIEDLSVVDFTRPISFLSQTTQSLELFQKVKEELLRRATSPQRVRISDTICRQVAGRAPHLREYATRYDMIIFVSGHKSSNGKALYGVCREVNPRSYMVETTQEIKAEWFEGQKIRSIGICGATSTPRWQMEQVRDYLMSFADQN
ncbi:MAG: 4-hydroxy-3-methylbut-2-enyl diphosphate reductase [Rikenellaceae bacterium]